MLGGIIICFLGYFVFLPWGDDYPSVQIASKLSITNEIQSNIFLLIIFQRLLKSKVQHLLTMRTRLRIQHYSLVQLQAIQHLLMMESVVH